MPEAHKESLVPVPARAFGIGTHISFVVIVADPMRVVPRHPHRVVMIVAAVMMPLKVRTRTFVVAFVVRRGGGKRQDTAGEHKHRYENEAAKLHCRLPKTKDVARSACKLLSSRSCLRHRGATQ